MLKKLVLGLSLSLFATLTVANEASQESQRDEGVSVFSYLYKQFEQACNENNGQMCGCVAETMLGAFSNEQREDAFARLESGEYSTSNLMSKYLGQYTQARKACTEE